MDGPPFLVPVYVRVYIITKIFDIIKVETKKSIYFSKKFSQIYKCLLGKVFGEIGQAGQCVGSL